MHDQLRIGVIAPPWLPVGPDGLGRIEMAIYSLISEVGATGHTVVLAAHEASAWPYDLLCGAAPIPASVQRGSAEFELEFVLRAYESLNCQRVDLIHDHTVIGPMLAPGLTDRPVVTTFHAEFHRAARRICLDLATTSATIALSSSQAANAPVPMTAVIPYGVRPERYPVGSGLQDFLVFFNRLSPTSGVLEAIDVSRKTGVPLIVASYHQDTADAQYFETSVRPRLGGIVSYVGEVGFAQRVELLGGARALLNPIGFNEPFGLNMIEALACATPVICRARGSAKEVVDHGITGLLADSRNELERAVFDVCAIDRVQCREDAEQRFSARRAANAHVALYQQVLADATVGVSGPILPFRSTTRVSF